MTDSLDIAANMIGVAGLLYLWSERKPRPEDDAIISVLLFNQSVF
jgi:hypothetical protein